MTVKVGQTYRDKRIGKTPFHDLRRLIFITAVDDRYIHATGRCQELRDGVWRDAARPTAKRKTRVLATWFSKDYELIEESS